jgi:hypothetical protein
MTPTPAAASLLLLCLLPTPVSASTQNVWAVILKVCSIIAFEGFTGIHSDDATLLLKFHSVMTYVCVAVILGASFYSEYLDGYEGAKTVFRLVTCGAYEPEGFMERCGAAPVICIVSAPQPSAERICGRAEQKSSNTSSVFFCAPSSTLACPLLLQKSSSNVASVFCLLASLAPPRLPASAAEEQQQHQQRLLLRASPKTDSSSALFFLLASLAFAHERQIAAAPSSSCSLRSRPSILPHTAFRGVLALLAPAVLPLRSCPVPTHTKHTHTHTHAGRSPCASA